jgi:hypothetical protein
MGLWPTGGNESRAREPRNRERRYLQEKKQVKPFFSTRLSGEPAGGPERYEGRISHWLGHTRSEIVRCGSEDDSIEAFFRSS